MFINQVNYQLSLVLMYTYYIYNYFSLNGQTLFHSDADYDMYYFSVNQVTNNNDVKLQ